MNTPQLRTGRSILADVAFPESTFHPQQFEVGVCVFRLRHSPQVQFHFVQRIARRLPGEHLFASAVGAADHLECTHGNESGTQHDPQFFSFDWRVSRPFKFGDNFSIISTVEMFNTFNNKNLVNPLMTPALFNFDSFLRQGVGDPRQLQLAVKLAF